MDDEGILTKIHGGRDIKSVSQDLHNNPYNRIQDVSGFLSINESNSPGKVSRHDNRCNRSP